MKPIGAHRHPVAPSAAQAYRNECLVWQRGICTGLPVCLRCGTLRQALILATWVDQAWPDCGRVVRPLDEDR